MKIYDISQELFGCEVYDGDRTPKKIEEKRILRGDMYNLSSVEMGNHNGTHIDAPYHFFDDGETVDEIPLEKTVGCCYVTEQSDNITGDKAREILCSAEAENHSCTRRLLIKGKGNITSEAARVFAEAGVYLIGVEGQSVGSGDSLIEVHKILLGKKVVLLEGIRLSEVNEGSYFLSSAPILMSGVDGAPCRAVLIKL